MSHNNGETVYVKCETQQSGEAMDHFNNGSGPLSSMRQYLCEFDPDTGPISSAPASQLHSAWMTYVTAFEDLCQVQNVPDVHKKPLFLLLGGTSFKTPVKN